MGDFEENIRVSFIGRVQEIDERLSQSGKHMFGAVIAAGWRLCETAVVQSTLSKKRHSPRPAPSRNRRTQVDRNALGDHSATSRPAWATEPPPQQRPLPVYALTDGLKQPMVREIMQQNIPFLIELVDEALPDWLQTRLEVPSLREALKTIHFPDCMESVERARRRFKLQELLVLQLAIGLQRRGREKVAKAPVCEATGKIHSRILNRLAHTLTKDQLKAVDEIGRDMSSDRPMNRLLQGDVGSGKTLVAQYAMLLCVAHGYQAALMAPTEVLARQHLHTLEQSSRPVACASLY